MPKFSMFDMGPNENPDIKKTAPVSAPAPSVINKPVQPFVGDKETQRRAMDWANTGSIFTPSVPQQPPLSMQPNNPTLVPTQPTNSVPVVPQGGISGGTQLTPPAQVPVNPQNEFEKTIAQAQAQLQQQAQQAQQAVNQIVPPVYQRPPANIPLQPVQPNNPTLVPTTQNPIPQPGWLNNLMGGMPQGVQHNPNNSILQSPMGW
jgi:hypothetical protein